MRALLVTRAAEADLDDIWMYLNERGELAADRVIDEISQKFDALCEYPFVGRTRIDVGDAYRSLPVGAYVIFYTVTDTTLEISRVLHGACDMMANFPPNSKGRSRAR